VFYDVNKIIALPKIAHELQVNAPSSSWFVVGTQSENFLGREEIKQQFPSLRQVAERKVVKFTIARKCIVRSSFFPNVPWISKRASSRWHFRGWINVTLRLFKAFHEQCRAVGDELSGRLQGH
jgi:hypothetical protein